MRLPLIMRVRAGTVVWSKKGRKGQPFRPLTYWNQTKSLVGCRNERISIVKKRSGPWTVRERVHRGANNGVCVGIDKLDLNVDGVRRRGVSAQQDCSCIEVTRQISRLPRKHKLALG